MAKSLARGKERVPRSRELARALAPDLACRTDNGLLSRVKETRMLDILGTPEDQPLAATVAAAMEQWTDLKVNTRTINGCLWATDTGPFCSAGYGALTLVEDMPINNPNYHSTRDTVETLNLKLLNSVTRAALAALS